MSLCESVPVWKLEKLQPHSCKEGCCGNADLMHGLRCCVIRMEKSGEVKSLVIWSVASYVFLLNGVNHLITIDRVKGAMHDNMFNVLCILSTVTHMSVNKIKLVEMCIKLIMPCFGPNESGFMMLLSNEGLFCAQYWSQVIELWYKYDSPYGKFH